MTLVSQHDYYAALRRIAPHIDLASRVSTTIRLLAGRCRPGNRSDMAASCVRNVEEAQLACGRPAAGTDLVCT